MNEIMKDISLKGNINYEKKKEINDYELFSLKITDSLYKKDIGKFLETLSSHFF
tara:strand:- start:320 stop:481 length:162 start_codon:yes stop_codon:yes gene_type:complete